MIKLALVEDHLMFRESMKKSLEAVTGFMVVEEAECGLEFEQKYDPSGIDLVLMDLRLNGQHGSVTCRNLVEKYPGIKIVVLSGQDDDATVMGMVRLGAVGFVSKNESFSEVVKTIREVMRYGYYFNCNVGRMMQDELVKAHKKVMYDDNLSIRFSRIELEIAMHCCNQLSTAEIAREMGLSARTIESHKKAMVDRTLSRNFMGVAIYLFHHNLLYPADLIRAKQKSSSYPRLSMVKSG